MLIIVKKGVKAVFSEDKSTVTVWCYPSGPHTGMPYKLVQKTWHNYCPHCKKKKGKKFKLKFNPKGKEEGELTCSSCDMDYCGASGKEKWNPSRAKLVPATVTPNKTTKVAESKTKSQSCSLSKAQARTKAKQLLKTGTGYKSELKIPIKNNILIHIDDYVSIDLEGFNETKNKTLHISEFKEDIDNQTYDITLQEGKPYFDTPYDGEYIIKDKNGGLLKTSSKNPYQAKCETVNVNIGLKDNSEIGKKIKLKGQKLGTVKKIYKWLKIKSAGGNGGWQYKKYKGHIVKSEDETKFGKKSAEKVWNSKKANCVDFSWLMAKMGEGAGKKVGVKRGTYTDLDGKKQGHMWNVYDGKNYDCSSSTGTTIDLKKVEKVD